MLLKNNLIHKGYSDLRDSLIVIGT